MSELQVTNQPLDSDTSGDRELVGMARGGSLNLVAAIVQQGSYLGVTIALAVLGQRDVGLYAQGFAYLTLLGLLSLSGFRAGLTRFVAMHLADGDRGAVHGTTRLGVGISAGGATVLGLGLALLSPVLSHGNTDLVEPLRWVGLALPASAFTDAALSATQGYRTMKPYALIGMVLEPLLRLSLTVAFTLTGFGLRGAMIALVISNWTAAVAALVALRRLLGRRPARLRFAVRELFGFSTISWFASLASTGLVWADTILLGFFRSNAEVGIYNVSTRIIMLATFVATPISASFAPRIAHLYHRGEMRSLARAYSAATSWTVRLSLPAFVVLLVLPADVLALFGHEYRVGATVTAVLAVGKIIDSATGPCGVMLNQSGRPGLSMLDNVTALALNVGLNLWLIPGHGLVGAAFAWSVSLFVVNAARVWQVRHVMAMLPFDATLLKGLLAAGSALVVALDIRLVLSPGHLRLAVGILAVLVVYVGVSALLGLSAEDKMIGRQLIKRFRGGRRGGGGRGRPTGQRTSDPSTSARSAGA